MASSFDLGFIDYCAQKSTISLHLADITAVNIAATVALVALGSGTLANAISNLSLCTPVKSQLHVGPGRASETIPTQSAAVAELGLMVTYQDTVTGKKYHMTIPGPDTTKMVSGTDKIDPADTEWVAFVTAFEANVLSEFGNPVTVLGGRLVGRNRKV